MKTEKPVNLVKPAPEVAGGLSLTERDYSILRRIGQMRVATVEQVHYLFWSQGTSLTSPKTALYRLSKLVRAGYLESGYTSARKKAEKVYALTEKALRLFNFAEQAPMEAGLPRSNEMREVLDASDARIILELKLSELAGKLLGWKSEHEIRSEAFSERAN